MFDSHFLVVSETFLFLLKIIPLGSGSVLNSKIGYHSHSNAYYRNGMAFNHIVTCGAPDKRGF